MADKRLHLRAITPDRTVLEREVDYVILRTIDGDKGILPGHEPCSVLLDDGLMKVFEGKQQTDSLVVLRGMATVHQDTVTVLSPIAAPPDQLESLLEEMERQRLEKEQQEARSALEIQRAETALRRMLVGGGEVSAYSVTKGLDQESEEKDGKV